MKVTLEQLSPTQVKLSVIVDQELLTHAKQHAIELLSKNIKVPGFREGKVPAAIAEKHIDPAQLQSEAIDDALNHAYGQAIQEQNVRPVLPPQIELTKFVPFTVLEFTATVEILGKITVPDYKKMKKSKPEASVSAEDIDQVIANMQTQLAEKKDVDRSSKNGDEVWIDFDGVDEKGKEVNGASGKDYPLVLGSNTFIPGFEENLVGVKVGDEKTFTLTFPKEYGVKALQGRKVTFTTKINKVREITKPNVDEAFAAKVGPFKSVKELKDDIKKQLLVEKQRSVDRDFEADVINELTAKSKVDLPQGLIDEQAASVLNELKQNITYRGLTYQEYLNNEGVDEQTYYDANIVPEAERRLKAGLVLSEISTIEKIDVTPEELEIRIQILKGQYQSDPQMQAELDKPENRRDIMARLLTEKTIAKLMEYVQKNA